MDRSILTADQVRSLFDYDKETGRLTWRVTRGGLAKAGDEAGWIEPGDPAVVRCAGYRRVRIDGKRYMAHNVIWLHVTGEWPENDVDHENRKRADNRWVNLRPATRSQNKANEGIRRNNTTGYKGVSFDKRRGKFRVYICKDYVRKFIGYFSTAEEASSAHDQAHAMMFGVYSGGSNS